MERSGISMAHYVINYCNEQDMPISNLKLQKLLYYIQAAFLCDKKKAFADDICPWKYGPVVEAVYHEFKMFVNHIIDEKMPEVTLSEKESVLANKVIDSYKNYTALEMVNKTHMEAPWKNAYNNNDDVIKPEDIKAYYMRDSEKIYGVHLSR